jgi:hypothetical protein
MTEKTCPWAGNMVLLILIVYSYHDVIPFNEGQLKWRVVEGIVVVGQFPVAPLSGLFSPLHPY